MRKTIRSAAMFAAVLAASIVLAGCPMQPTYPSTITPIYAATSGNGLYVYNGTSWTNYTNANTSAGLASTALTGVVVFGSGTGASVLVGGNSGVSEFNGTSWIQTTGLGSVTVNSLKSSGNVYASTAGGLSILNPDGATWTNDAAVTPVDAFSLGAYTLVAAAGTLSIYFGTSLAGTVPAGTIVPTSSLTSVFVDAFGDLIVGTNKGLGIQYAGNASWVNPVSGPAVTSVYADLSGNIYAATPSGLYIVNTTATLVLSGKVVHCVCVDGAGAIYAGTSTGLMVSKDGGSNWTTVLSTATAVTAVATTAPLYSF